MQTAQVKLGVVRREMRVTAGGFGLPRWRALGPPSSTFAQAIMRRYTGRQLPRPTLAMVFGQLRAGVALRPVYHRTEVHLAPRVELTVLAWSRPIPATNGGTRPQAALRLERQVETRVVQRRVSAPTLPPQADQLVRRLVVRGERIESVAEARATIVPRPGMQQDVLPGSSRRTADIVPAQPVARVTRRPAAARPRAEEGLSMPDAQRSPAYARPHVADAGPHTLDSGPIDLNHLTNQVIQAIDRRIIAQRERLGRI